uniref:Uncharacterized protein n=1 Tax=Rhizophora mucronata TaxID=61149 RepID=A0A2P2Q5T9_RHIMU
MSQLTFSGFGIMFLIKPWFFFRTL